MIEIEFEGDFGPECRVCAGPGEPLGKLGSLSYYRCRGCHSVFAEDPPSSAGSDQLIHQSST